MNLILQGPAATQRHADDAATLTRPASIERLGPSAWRLTAVEVSDAVTAWCAAHRLDCAWVPDDRRLADLRLLAIDMDSTLITIECIDEIGDLLGRKREVAAITEDAMRGSIGYADSLARRVALLAGLEESALQHVYDHTLRLSPGAERLLEACHRHGIESLLVSGGFTFFTERLKTRLGFADALANVLEVAEGRLTGRIVGPVVDAEAKAEKFRQRVQARGLTREQTIAIGDGANDLRMMAQAGVSVAWRAKPVVRAAATYTLDHADLDGVLHLFG